jgi:hypothetical protein
MEQKGVCFHITWPHPYLSLKTVAQLGGFDSTKGSRLTGLIRDSSAGFLSPRAVFICAT